MSRATEYAVSKPSQEIPLSPQAAEADEREEYRDGAAVLAMHYVLGHPVASPIVILLAFEIGRIALERALAGSMPRWTHPSHWIPLAVLGPLLLVLFPLLSWIRTRQAEQAKALVLESLDQSEQIQKISILGFARLSEVHDSETGNHIVRMAHYSLALARELGRQPDFSSYITRRYCDDLFIAAPLHDIGKVGIIDGILKKKGLLSPEEYEIMKMHTILGGNLLEELERKLPFRTFYSLGKSIAYHHHQCWDGSGYPNVFIGNSYFVEPGVGTPLKGEEIPLSARIVALADVYDALVSRRCYKEPIPPERAREMIFSKSGSQFDPAVVAAFHRIEDEFLRIGREFRD